MRLAPAREASSQVLPDPIELLIKEARRKTRRRRLIMGEILLAVVVLAAVVAYGIGHIGNGARPTTATSPISSVATGATSPKDTITLSGDAVGSVRFGEAQSAAATSLVKLIGKSDGGMQKVNQGDCIISSALYWPNFAAYFYRGKFDGYQTGNYVTGKSEPTFNGVTPRGLRVDYTLAQAQKQYGSAFSTNGAQSGVYAAVTKTGTIRGYLSKEPNQAPATKVKLLTISAGSVGCPAMSPG